MIKDVIIRERLLTAMVGLMGHVGQKSTCRNHSRRGPLLLREIKVYSQGLALSLSACAAQTVAYKTPEPESIGVFLYLDSTTQTLKRLPKEN